MRAGGAVGQPILQSQPQQPAILRGLIAIGAGAAPPEQGAQGQHGPEQHRTRGAAIDEDLIAVKVIGFPERAEDALGECGAIMFKAQGRVKGDAASGL